jgi:hypothetical protein
LTQRTEKVDAPVGRLGGARAEILDVVCALTVRRSALMLPFEDIMRDMKRRQSPNADTTVRTMVSSHMLMGGPDGAAPDLQRVDRGRYRLDRGPHSEESQAPHVATYHQDESVINAAVGESLISLSSIDRVFDRYLQQGTDWRISRDDWRRYGGSQPIGWRFLHVRTRSRSLRSREGNPFQDMPGWHHTIAWALGVIAESCHEAGLPLLTAVIYGKTT